MTETYDSIEFPGYKRRSHPTEHTDEMFAAFGRSLRNHYEEKGFEVLHVLSYMNNGLDWFTGERVKPDEHGFEVIYK